MSRYYPDDRLWIEDAAKILGFKAPSSVRNAVRNGELTPCGRGPHGKMEFFYGDLIAFKEVRAALYPARQRSDFLSEDRFDSSVVMG